GNFDRGPFGQIVEVEDLPRTVLNDNLRMQVGFVFDDRPPDVTANLFLGAHRLAFEAVFEPDATADFRQNRNRVRVPLTEKLFLFDFIVLGNEQRRTVRDRITFEFPVFRVDDDDLTVSGEHDVLPFAV